MESAKKTVASHLRDRGLDKQIDEVLERIPSGEELKEKTQEYLHQAQAKLGEMGERLEQLGRKFEAQLRKNPVKTVAIGAAVLAGIALLVSRRFR